MLDRLIGGAWSYVVAGVLALATVAGIFGAGWKMRDSSCDAAALRVRVASLELDLKAARGAEALATEQTAAAETDAAKLQQKVDAYAASLKGRKSDPCRLTGDDVRRLREIR